MINPTGMERIRTRYLALTGAFVLGIGAGQLGCQALHPHSPFHGSMSCSCGTASCNCAHCTGAQERCSCRGTDAYGSPTEVGEPGDSK